ncbi:hypothetical protein cypCar_00005205, partial [Cyprinus carpio]
LCNQLLTVLIVLTSPLAELHRDFPACEGSSLCLFELLVSEPCYNPAVLLQTILHNRSSLQIIISYSYMNLAIQAISFIFTNLPSIIASLPLPVRFLFTVAEKRLSQHARQLRSTSLLLWVILVRLCHDLENGDTLELLSGQPLERGAKDRLSLLSECLQVSLGQQKGVPKPLVHKVLQGLEEKRPKMDHHAAAEGTKALL